MVNKIDLPSADPQRCLHQIESNFELNPAQAILVSAKSGINVQSILPKVIETIPPPTGDSTAPPRILLVDSWYDNYKGVILLIRVFEGQISAGDQLISFATGAKYIVGEVGIMYPNQTRQITLRAGQVGYLFFNPGMMELRNVRRKSISNSLALLAYTGKGLDCHFVATIKCTNSPNTLLARLEHCMDMSIALYVS